MYIIIIIIVVYLYCRGESPKALIIASLESCFLIPRIITLCLILQEKRTRLVIASFSYTVGL